jgi:hypothetical protein
MKAFSFHCVCAKNIMCHTQCGCVWASLCALHDLAEVVVLLFLSLCDALWINDMVLNFCSIILRAKKCHPCLRPFDWWRMNLWPPDMISLAFDSVTMSSDEPSTAWHDLFSFWFSDDVFFFQRCYENICADAPYGYSRWFPPWPRLHGTLVYSF